MKIVRPFESRKNVSSCPFSGTQPPSGVRGVAGRAEEAESLILARYPAYAWCAETGGVGGRARASNAREDAGERVGGTFRDAVF